MPRKSWVGSFWPMTAYGGLRLIASARSETNHFDRPIPRLRGRIASSIMLPEN
jgi:hypothetical protein